MTQKTYSAFQLSSGLWAVEVTTKGTQANGKPWRSTYTPGLRHASQEAAQGWIDQQTESPRFALAKGIVAL